MCKVILSWKFQSHYSITWLGVYHIMKSGAITLRKNFIKQTLSSKKVDLRMDFGVKETANGVSLYVSNWMDQSVMSYDRKEICLLWSAKRHRVVNSRVNQRPVYVFSVHVRKGFLTQVRLYIDHTRFNDVFLWTEGPFYPFYLYRLRIKNSILTIFLVNNNRDKHNFQLGGI